jgi:hypothetical protein
MSSLLGIDNRQSIGLRLAVPKAVQEILFGRYQRTSAAFRECEKDGLRNTTPLWTSVILQAEVCSTCIKF